MYPYRLAVCEDDPVVLEGIGRFCGEVLTEEQIAYEITAFSSAEELEAAIKGKEQAFHLLLLDIKLENKSGMELAQELRRYDERTSIIFITGYESYMGMGYEVQAAQFLTKPLSWDKLRTALLREWKQKHCPRTILLQKGRQSLRILTDEFLYAEADGRHGVRMALREGCEHFAISLTELEEKIPGESCLRCHNSYLVNLNHVRRLEQQTFLLDCGETVPVSRKYWKKCQEALVDSVNR